MTNITFPKISVIIPVYKAEKYIHKCMDSLLKQTFTDYEIILVDDGSPDNSGKICDEYSNIDNRIRTIHKTNGGVSSARQCGIDNATGEYTIHVDPDDWVKPTMLEELYQKAIEEDADMVICDFIKYYTKNKQIYVNQQPSSLNHQIVLQELFKHLQGSLCNKLIKKECYGKFNIKYPTSFNLYEDLYVCTCLLTNPLKVAYLNKAFYFYTITTNENSMVKKIGFKVLHEDKCFYREMTILLNKNIYVCNLFKSSMSYALVLRAFKSKLYTGTEFKQKYGDYKKYIFKSPHGNFIGKIICYLSCIGGYSILNKLYR